MDFRIRVGSLKPLHPPEVSGPRPDLRRLTDAELMEAVERPRNGDHIKISDTTGFIMDGSGRAYELIRRAGDPHVYNHARYVGSIRPLRDREFHFLGSMTIAKERVDE